MAMITCKECLAKISDQAAACPQCGAKAPKPTSRITIFLGGLFIIFVAKSVIQGSEAPKSPPKSEAQIVADTKKEDDFQKVVKVASWAKRNAKNPKSFELTYGGITNDGVVCIEYRATNSFNATVPGRYIMSDSVSGDTSALWNKHCAHKPISDFSYARQAL